MTLARYICVSIHYVFWQLFNWSRVRRHAIAALRSLGPLRLDSALDQARIYAAMQDIFDVQWDTYWRR